MDEDSQKGKVFFDGSLGCLFTKASCFLFFDQECCYIMAMLALGNGANFFYFRFDSGLVLQGTAVK